jgi:hypothetical protein
MIEKYLSVDDDVVKRKTVYKVAFHHWPEQLILKNVNEKRFISKLISREEAGNYGLQFVDASIHPFAHDDSNQKMHVQAPTVSEIDVSTLVSTFYSTPKKPAAVDCGVSFSFPVDVETAPMLLPMMCPVKSTAKPAFDCSIPYFPSNLFDQSPSIQWHPSKMLLPNQPASNDPPSNDFFHPVNPPASVFLPVDVLNLSLYPNTGLPTRPTPIDCCVFIPSPLLQVSPSNILLPIQPASENDDCCCVLPNPPSIFDSEYNPDIPRTCSTPIDCCVPAPLNPLPSNHLPSNPLPSNPTVGCCVMPDSPDIKLSVNTLHEYIKRKVLQHGIGQIMVAAPKIKSIHIRATWDAIDVDNYLLE